MDANIGARGRAAKSRLRGVLGFEDVAVDLDAGDGGERPTQTKSAIAALLS